MYEHAMNNTQAQKLMDFIDKSPSVYHVVHNAAHMLTKAGFIPLEQKDSFDLKAGKAYFITNNGSALIAWRMPEHDKVNGFRIIGSHSDSPTFRVKPNPQITVQNHYIALNTEVYGSPILSAWLDRPLSLAGRIILKTDKVFEPHIELIQFDKALLTIPGLAIHMNREVNEGYAYNKQKDTLPLLGMLNKHFEKDDFLLTLIAQELNIPQERIADFDLYLYDRQKGCFVGANGEFFSSGKIDNLGMMYASLEALTSVQAGAFVQTAAVFDNEEVGSATAQGAASPFLRDVLQRIVLSTCGNEKNEFEEMQKALARSFLISADQAHALHPNYTEKNDITNFPLINKGPVIKLSAAMTYTTDGFSAAVFKSLCTRCGVPFQIFVNRSDMKGGSTIGPISLSNLNIKSIDMGNPVLAMHSIRELGGTADQDAVVKVFKEFYTYG